MKWVTTGCIALAFIVAGCSSEPDEEARAQMDGKALFESFCADCHGKKGEGKFLHGIPPNRHTEKSVTEVVRQIREGSNHAKHPMPPMPQITPEEAHKISKYLIDTLKKQAK